MIKLNRFLILLLVFNMYMLLLVVLGIINNTNINYPLVIYQSTITLCNILAIVIAYVKCIYNR